MNSEDFNLDAMTVSLEDGAMDENARISMGLSWALTWGIISQGVATGTQVPYSEHCW